MHPIKWNKVYAEVQEDWSVILMLLLDLVFFFPFMWCVPCPYLYFYPISCLVRVKLWMLLLFPVTLDVFNLRFLVFWISKVIHIYLSRWPISCDALNPIVFHIHLIKTVDCVWAGWSLRWSTHLLSKLWVVLDPEDKWPRLEWSFWMIRTVTSWGMWKDLWEKETFSPYSSLKGKLEGCAKRVFLSWSLW